MATKKTSSKSSSAKPAKPAKAAKSSKPANDKNGKKGVPAKAPAKPASSAKGAAKAPAKPAAKAAAKTPAKVESKKPQPAPASNAKNDAKKGVAKPESKKPEVKKAAAPATPAKGTKAAAPASAGKSAADAGKKKEAPAPAGKKSDAKPAPAKKEAEAAKAAAKPATKPATKKGPIDFSTAKSVAAAAVVATPDAQGYVMINGRRVRVLSAAPVSKRKTSAAAAPAAEEKAEPAISTIKTRLSAKDLEHYQQLLLQKRRQVVGMVTGMEDEALRSSGGNLSNMPLHMADIGTDTYDQDFTLGMAESERGLLQEIDDALRRIEERTYGVCQMSGQPIPKARLDAKPWAKYTIESARRVESGQFR